LPEKGSKELIFVSVVIIKKFFVFVGIEYLKVTYVYVFVQHVIIFLYRVQIEDRAINQQVKEGYCFILVVNQSTKPFLAQYLVLGTELFNIAASSSASALALASASAIHSSRRDQRYSQLELPSLSL